MYRHVGRVYVSHMTSNRSFLHLAESPNAVESNSEKLEGINFLIDMEKQI